MTIEKVREQLAIDRKLIFTSELLRITADEIHYIVDFADRYLQYVK
ncbi:hypothetical protein ACQKII_02360 [Lysinibacillus sp. NPDC048646]